MTTLVHVGEFLTGRITATIEVTSLRWTDVLNGAGSIDVTVAESEVRKYDLRQLTNGVRNFLAVEVDGRIRQAGPIWSRTWDWKNGSLQLGASGMWSYLDKRVIYPNPSLQTEVLQKWVTTVTGKSLGGVARALVESAIQFAQSAVPIVLPPDEAGSHTETFPVWAVMRYGEQLRQITQRAVDAPDIRFPARRTSADPRFIEWAMQVGTEPAPALRQAGPDWVFDASAPKSPVLGITTDEDATGMGQQVWLTGNGQEEDILMWAAYDLTLYAAGWPMTEVDESRPTVEDRTTLSGHAQNLLKQVARPVEVFKVAVRQEAAREVVAGDFCRLATKGDVWLGDMDRSMRVRQVSGDQSDTLTLEMFPLAATL